MVLELLTEKNESQIELIEQDWKSVKKIYMDNFPFMERVPFFYLKKKAIQSLKYSSLGKILSEEQSRSECFTAKEEGKIVGFAYTITHGELVYLYFLAISKDEQGKGYGGEILTALKEIYSGKKLFLSRERLDEKCHNMNQRIKRHEFYLKHGFEDLPCRMQEAAMIYDVMGIGGTISEQDYDILMTKWAGKLIKTMACWRVMEK